MRLENKVILITASTRGISLACVKACAKEGTIVYMAARNLEIAAKTANELNAMEIGLPEEIGAAVVYFASDESAYTTGQILAVSGGFGLATPIYGDITGTNGSRA